MILGKLFLKQDIVNHFDTGKGIKASNTNKEKIDGVKIKKLITKYSTPSIFVSHRNLKKRYQKLKSALDSYYPNYDIAYSFKTNNIAGICSIFKEFGAKAEVVSGYEYFLAKKIGYQGKDIIFNGPYKKEEELTRAFKEGTLVNVDNLDELRIIKEISKSLNELIKVGIRLNSSKWSSHFGFNIESNEAFKACQEIISNKKLVLSGFQMHIGFNIDNVDDYVFETKIIGDLASKVESKLGIKISYIDIGGGFPAGLKPFTKKVWNLPDINDYVKAISLEMLKKFPKRDIKLILEPGRYLVDEGVLLTTKVISAKKAKGAQEVIVDTTLDHLATVTYSEQEVSILRKIIKSDNLSTNIYGATCRENDVLVKNKNLPEIKTGDYLIFNKIGAYNISWQNQFCYPRPAIVLIDERNKTRILRKKETFEDIIKSQKIS
jgi:diaminopimelate decarboxylase